MQNPQDIETKAEARYRVFLILWIAILASMALLFTLALAIPNVNATPNPTLTFVLIGVAFTVFIVSVLVKQRTVNRAIDKRDVVALQSGYITSFALCESAALFGLLDHFVTGSNYYYLSFAIAALGMLLHFPKKDHVRATI